MFQTQNNQALDRALIPSVSRTRPVCLSFAEATDSSMQQDIEQQIELAEEIKCTRARKPRGRLREELVTGISGDRRARRRYPLSLEVAYKVLRKYQVCQTGTGRTIDMSGNGISFETEEGLEEGCSVELAIAWPVLLNKTCLLRLIVTGKIVRSGPGQAAMRVQGYEFRTKGSGALKAMAAGASLPS